MREKNRLRVTFKIILFTVYVVLMIYLLFVAESFGRGTGGYSGLNLTPFAEIKRYLTNISSLGFFNVCVNLCGNVVIFMPLGYSLPSLFTKGERWPLNYVIICATFSVSVEMLQFATGTGSCDVDDVILNTLGGFLGYVVYAMTHNRPSPQEENEEL